MTTIKFARMCEALENANGSNRKIQIIRESFRTFSRPYLALELLCNELDSNNIGKERALTWMASTFEVFETEVQAAIDTWGDLGEGMYQFLDEPDDIRELSLNSLETMLNLDCISINTVSFRQIKSRLEHMTPLEVKWFIRYWLRTPRNGISRSTVIKAMAKEYPEKCFLSPLITSSTITELWNWAENDQPLPSITIGRFIKPMLAQKHKPPYILPENYCIDIKYDGNRYQIHKDVGEVIIFSRSGKIVTNQFPDLRPSIMRLNSKSFILDCEILPVDYWGRDDTLWRPKEHKLMAIRVHSKDNQAAVEKCPVACVVFDVLAWNGTEVMSEPYQHRLNLIDNSLYFNEVELIFKARRWDKEQGITAAYNFAINAGFEGVMIKDLDADYSIGKRTKTLLKHKPPQINLDVVITTAKYGEGKRHDVFGTYGISVRDENGGFVSIGSVGTGLSDADLRRLTSQLKQTIEFFRDGNFHVLPRLVLEVTCDLISQDRDGNYGLRFPRVKRIRDDKFAADCNTLADIMELA